MQQQFEVPPGLEDLTDEELAFIMGGLNPEPQVGQVIDDEIELNEVELAWLKRCEQEEAEQQAIQQKQALFRAVKEQDLGTLQALISTGIDLRQQNEARQDVFDFAIQKGATKLLAVLLKADESRMHEANAYGDYLVHTAAIADDVECMDVLNQAGAQLNKTNKHGNCPLIFSIQCNKLRMAEYLVAAQMKAQPKDSDRQQALGYIPTVSACIMKLESINFTYDLVLLRTFLNHALTMDRAQDQKISWRDFSMVALAYQFKALKEGKVGEAEAKLLLAKQICTVELLCQKVHLARATKLNGHAMQVMQKQVDAMAERLTTSCDKEIEQPESVARLCQQLKLLNFSAPHMQEKFIDQRTNSLKM